MTENQLLREALQEIANWPDGGNRYGQEKIKAFASQVLAAQPAPGVPTLSKDQIREVFLSHGFTIKEGQTDLKPYVYDAADALLKLAYAALAQPAEGGKAREFFAYHSDMGVEFFNGPDAEAAAKSLCDENLKLERAEAESTDEWADDRAESIRWGVVLGRAKFFENPGQEGEDSGDYKMVGYTAPPASQGQPAEGGEVERAVQESWINTIRRASRSIGMTRDDSIVLCHIADHMERTTPPASQEQAAEGGEAVHQIASAFVDDHPFTWRDASEEAYQLTPAHKRRILYATPPASPSQAQQPSSVVHVCHLKDSVCGDRPANWCDECPKRKQQQPIPQAWANETGLRQIECPSCGDLAVAYDPQQPSGEWPSHEYKIGILVTAIGAVAAAIKFPCTPPVTGPEALRLALEIARHYERQPSGEVVAWRTFDGEGGYEYRDFEGNENYAAEWAKRNPQYKEWVEPLTLATPKPEPTKPLFAASVAARKWANLQEQGHRMQSIAFDGGPGGPGTIDPWGKVTWGVAPKPEPMTEEQADDLIGDLSEWSGYVEVDTAPRTLEKHVREVLAKHGITAQGAQEGV